MKRCSIILLVLVSMSVLLLSPATKAQVMNPGDCNGDAAINAADLAYMINYLFAGGAAPTPTVRPNCDCDNSPGFTYADALWLTEFLFIGGVPLYFPSGTSLTQSSQSMFYSDLRASGAPGRDRIKLMVAVHPSENLLGFYIPFSFDNGPGYADISVASVDFTNSIHPAATVTWDNAAKLLYLHLDPQLASPIGGGAQGELATIIFTQNAPGSAVFLTKESSSRHTPLIFPTGWVTGGGALLMTPSYVEKAVGEATGDRFVDIDDVVALVDYIFNSVPLVYWP